MPDDGFESRVLAFERAWQQPGSCEIGAFLTDLPFDVPADRRRLLVELICVDLELRWKNARRTEIRPLESYVAQFPELVALDSLPLDVIREEFRVRHRWGDRPSLAGFLARFRARRDEIATALAEVLGELAAESTEPGQRAPVIPAQGPGQGPLEIDPEGPLLSHHDFLLRRLIGAGRMGKVYEATQRGSTEPVAVKFLRKPFRPLAEVVRRFIGEARTVAKLAHPNIVGTHGLGRTPGGSYFIVMELVNGFNLAALASRGPVAVDQAVGWLLDACGALEHAHERGVVHCDLKPANLLRDETGRIRVTDFGLARSLAEATPWTAEVEGTAPFMAPEQASRCWGPIDVRTDVYGLGAVLFTLLTGRPPFAGRRIPDILAEVVSATPAVLASSLRHGLPEPVSDVCRRCLAKEPAQRFTNVPELRRALDRLRMSEARS